MASYTAQVNTIHKKFNTAIKKAKAKQALNKAYSSHKKDHERVLKKTSQRRDDNDQKSKSKIGISNPLTLFYFN